MIEELTKRNSELRFYGVQSAEEMNNFCAPGGRKIYKLPTGAQVQQVACTAGKETFLVEPLFSRLSLRDQSLLLIHERLTTLRDQYGGKNYSAIARFTTGLNIYLNLFRDQMKGKYSKLSEGETKLLTEFYTATEEIELRNKEVTENSFQWSAHSYGGGRVHETSDVDPSAIVSLDSVIPAQSKVGERAKITNFTPSLRAKVVIEAEAILANVKYNGLSLFVGQNASLKNVEHLFRSLEMASDIKIGMNSIITNSKLYVNYQMTIGNNVQLTDSILDYDSSKSRKIAPDQILSNLSLSESIDDSFFPSGVTPPPLEVTIPLRDISFDLGDSLPRTSGNLSETFKDGLGNTVTLLGEYRQTGRSGFTNPRYNYLFSSLVVKVEMSKFTMVQDPKLKMLDENGKLTTPGYLRGPYLIPIQDSKSMRILRFRLSHQNIQIKDNSLSIYSSQN